MGHDPDDYAERPMTPEEEAAEEAADLRLIERLEREDDGVRIPFDEVCRRLGLDPEELRRAGAAGAAPPPPRP